MKKILKQFTAFVIICTMLCSVFTVQQTQANAKKDFWLSGVSTTAGGNMQMSLKNKKKILLKGKFSKSSNMEGLSDAAEKKGAVSLKVHKNCTVVFLEAENEQSIGYNEWVKDNSYKKGEKISFISATFEVKNKKIVRICFSA